MSFSLNYVASSEPHLSTTISHLPSSTYSALVIDLQATVQNYDRLSGLAPQAKCGAVLKADGYGLGAVPIALRLYEKGCRQFFVAYLDEGVHLRQSFIQNGLDGDIFVLNGLLPGLESNFSDYNLLPVLTDMDQIQRWSAHCKASGAKLPAALHIDTGMARTGLPYKDIQEMTQSRILESIDLQLILSQMVYSHLENPVYSAFQRQRFDAALRHLPKVPASLAKSGAIFLGEDYHYQLIRPGIGLHGINPTLNQSNPLLPVVSLWARIYQLQHLTKGQTIGYSQTFKVECPMKVATLTLGYADGYPWNLANKGYVYIGPYKAPIVGRISMDLITIDVTHIPENLTYNGAWVQVIGQEITIEKLAQEAGTVPYEILLGLGKRFQRIYA